MTVYTHAVQQESLSDSSESRDDESIHSKGIRRLKDPSLGHHFSQGYDRHSDFDISGSDREDRFPSSQPK